MQTSVLANSLHSTSTEQTYFFQASCLMLNRETGSTTNCSLEYFSKFCKCKSGQQIEDSVLVMVQLMIRSMTIDPGPVLYWHFLVPIMEWFLATRGRFLPESHSLYIPSKQQPFWNMISLFRPQFHTWDPWISGNFDLWWGAVIWSCSTSQETALHSHPPSHISWCCLWLYQSVIIH